MKNENLWQGLRAEAKEQLDIRCYASPSRNDRLSNEGLDAGDALKYQAELQAAGAWIPGVEVLPRSIFTQKHRGWFAEFGREGHGRLGELGIWPRQWSVARMFAGSAKGFHIHPPHIPEGESAENWFQNLFGPEAEPSLRPYHLEQWDVMFFVHGRVEFLLCDERVGLPRRKMKLFIDSDDRRNQNNAAIVIPPGVAHALRVEGSEDLMMVYGTTTSFEPDFEGRIASEVENLSLPPEWARYLAD